MVDTSWIWEQLLHRNVQRFRGGLVFKAHRLCVSLTARLVSNKDKKKRTQAESWTRRCRRASSHSLFVLISFWATEITIRMCWKVHGQRTSPPECVTFTSMLQLCDHLLANVWIPSIPRALMVDTSRELDSTMTVRLWSHSLFALISLWATRTTIRMCWIVYGHRTLKVITRMYRLVSGKRTVLH